MIHRFTMLPIFMLLVFLSGISLSQQYRYKRQLWKFDESNTISSDFYQITNNQGFLRIEDSLLVIETANSTDHAAIVYRHPVDTSKNQIWDICFRAENASFPNFGFIQSTVKGAGYSLAEFNSIIRFAGGIWGADGGQYLKEESFETDGNLDAYADWNITAGAVAVVSNRVRANTADFAGSNAVLGMSIGDRLKFMYARVPDNSGNQSFGMLLIGSGDTLAIMAHNSGTWRAELYDGGFADLHTGASFNEFPGSYAFAVDPNGADSWIYFWYLPAFPGDIVNWPAPAYSANIDLSAYNFESAQTVGFRFYDAGSGNTEMDSVFFGSWTGGPPFAEMKVTAAPGSFWSGDNELWEDSLAPVSEAGSDTLSDFHIAGMEVNPDSGFRFSVINREERNPADQNLGNPHQGGRLCGLTDWKSFKSAGLTGNPHFFIGDLINDAGKGKLEVFCISRNITGTPQPGWINVKNSTEQSNYELRQVWGYGARSVAAARGNNIWETTGAEADFRTRCVVEYGGTYHYFYESGNTAGFTDSIKIRLRTASLPTGPWSYEGIMIDPAADFASEYTQASAPFVFHDPNEEDPDSVFKMYVMVTKAAFEPLIAYFVSGSLAGGWSKVTGGGPDGAVLAKSGGDWREDGVNEPFILYREGDGNPWVMYCSGFKSGVGWEIGVFESADGITWSIPPGVTNPVVERNQVRTVWTAYDQGHGILTVSDATGFTTGAAIILTNSTDPQEYVLNKIRRIDGDSLYLMFRTHMGASPTVNAFVEQVSGSSITPHRIFQSGGKVYMDATTFQAGIGTANPGFIDQENIITVVGDSLFGGFELDGYGSLNYWPSIWGEETSAENINYLQTPYGYVYLSISGDVPSSAPGIARDKRGYNGYRNYRKYNR